jgi:glycosyltransferase involved in cell wall biosynthesis
MLNLMRGLAGSGFEVHVLVGPGEYEYLESLHDTVRIHRGPADDASQAVAWLRTFLSDLSPQLVLSNGDAASTRLVAARGGQDRPPSIVLRIGTQVAEKLRRKGLLARWRARRRLRHCYRAADLLVANSEDGRRALAELLGADAPPIRVLANPLDVEHCRALARAEPAHRWFGAATGRLVVSVGRLARTKDHATLLRAVARLPRDLRLVIFGEGPQRPRLLELAARLGIRERIDLPGFTDNPFTYVSRADVFVLSSRFEGSPNVLLEALAVRTPVVATDCPGGTREILGHGRYGRLVPVGQPQPLADAILATLQQPPPSELFDEAVAGFRLDRAVGEYARVLHLQCSGLRTSPP